MACRVVSEEEATMDRRDDQLIPFDPDAREERKRAARRTVRGRKALAAERSAHAYRLYLEGESFEAIAREVGYRSKSAAWKAVQRALRETATAGVEELRKAEADRLDLLWRSLMPRVRRHQVSAVEAGVRVSARRAALLGLDVPKRITIEDVRAEVERVRAEAVAAGLLPEGFTMDDVMREAERILENA